MSCNGDTDGSIDLSVNGGVDNQNYTYAWSNGSSTEDLSGIGAGTYSVLVTDANGCSTSETVVITEADTITSSFTTTDWNNFEIQCNGGNNGEIVLNVLGGVTGQSYSYTIDGVSNPTNIFSNLTAGTYVVSATDVNGCSTSETVTMTEPTAVISSYTQSDYNGFGVSCNGDSDGSIDLTVNGGVGLHTYAWSNTATSEDLNGIGVGTYSVITIDANGCSTQDTVIITEPDVFVGGQLTASQTICQNDILDSLITTSSPTGGNPPYTFDWEVDDGSGFVSLSNNNLDWLVPPVIIDTVIYKIIYSDDYQCNTFVEFSTVIVNPLPISYPITGDMNVCSNQSDASYTLSTTPINYRYEWFTSDGTIVGTNESRNCLINWPLNPGISALLEVDVRVLETGCHISTSGIIDITFNESPDKNNIIHMNNTNILVCNDSTFGVNYQWGYTNIQSELEVIENSDTLRYNQFLSVIDTLVNRYWVITSFNYGNDTCSTISYYNPPPEPLEIIDLNKELLFYPNPARDIVNWKGTSVDLIKLFDSVGRLVNCEVDYLNNKISLDNVRPGIYFLKYRSRNGEFINKLIVK